MRNISLFVATSLIISLVFAVFIENARAGTGMPPCMLEIEKVAIPADDTLFNFIATGDIIAEQTLSDPSNPIFIGPLGVDQTATITEELPPGWELQSIECTQGVENCSQNGGFEPCLSIAINEETNSIFVECLDIDTGSCTFTNTLVPDQVPTLSEWGLITMAGILGLVGFMVIRRRKLTA